MGKVKHFDTRIIIRASKAMVKDIDDSLGYLESRTDFVRNAINRELERRAAIENPR
jgi:metal-responsive CopG/Arc/MetJ family transcriptional regulator